MRARTDQVGDIWYRAEERWIDDGSEMYVGVEIVMVEWAVSKVTPCGVWLTCPTSPRLKRRFALADGSRAYRRTSADAMAGLIARKRRQIQILEGQMRVAVDALEAAKDEAKRIAS